MWRLWLISSNGIFVLLYGCGIKQYFCSRRVRKLAPPFFAFCVLICRMFHLEHRLDQEALRGAVVSTERQHLADDPAARLTLDMDNKIDRFSDLRFGVGESCLCVVAHDQIGETAEGFLCRVGVNRCQ